MIVLHVAGREEDTAGVLYVNDMDLFIMNSSMSTLELWQEVTDSTTDWSLVLCQPGGTAKGEKCFGQLVDYDWNMDGAWTHANVTGVDLGVMVLDGSQENCHPWAK